MATWKKFLFVTILVVFIGLSLSFTFFSIARDTFEYREAENIEALPELNGWEFFGFNGNSDTKEIYIDFVRDKKGENPDTEKPVVAIGDFTVVSDEYVEFIHIGKHVQHISESSFYYCKQLKAVFVDEENPCFTSVDGVLYTKDMKTLILHPILNGQWQVAEGISDTADTYIIPEGVENLGSFSFYKNSDLVHLTLPSTLKTIGDMTFFNCYSLWTVWLPEGLETIGADAFSYCGSISPVLYIPSTIKSIDDYAFFSCTGIKAIYMGVENEEAFTAGESWLPKNESKVLFNVAAEPIYGKTLEDAQAEKIRLDNEAAKEG